MLKGDHTDGATGLSSPADRRNWLGNDSLLTPGLREVEGRELGDFGEFTGARRRLRKPVVLSAPGHKSGDVS